MADQRHADATARQRTSWERFAPALSLFVLAPLVAEYLLGDFPLTWLPLLVVLAPLYGGAAVLIREVARRAGRGWPSILLLALAFGVLVEGVLTQSLFNPGYAHAHLLERGFLPALGIAGPWTLYVLTLHTVWSICVPILLVEELTGERRTRPWLDGPGLAVVIVLLVLGALASAAGTWPTYAFRASPGQISSVAVVAVCLVGLALAAPRPHRVAPTARGAPFPLVVFAVGFIAAGLFLGLFPAGPTWTVLVADLVLWVGVALAVAIWSKRAGWGPRHRFALAAAAMSTYAWHSFLTNPLVPTPSWLVLTSHIVFAVGAVALIVGGARALRPAEGFSDDHAGAGGRHEQTAGSEEHWRRP